MAAFAARAGNLQHHDPPARPGCSRRRPDARRISNPRSRRRARSRARSCRASARPGHDRRLVPVDRADARARVAGRARRPGARPAAGDPRPRGGHRRGDQADPAGRPDQPVRDQDVLPDGRQADRGRLPLAPGSRTTRSSGRRCVGSRRRVARTSTATASTRASSPAAATRVVDTRQTTSAAPPLFGNAALQAARHAAGAPGQEAARTTHGPLLQEQARPTSTTRRSEAGAVKRAIRKHLRDFVAIIGLFVIAMGVAAVILVAPAALPARLGAGASARTSTRSTPSSRRRRRSCRARGRPSNIAGVPVGEIGKVEPEERRRRRADEDQEQVHADLPATPPCCCARRPGSRT